MTTSGRGNPRFKGGGSLWKTSWRGRTPYTEMAFFEGFSSAFGGNYYEDAAVIPGLAAGFFVGGVVRLLEPPALGTVDTIARSTTGGANEGWDLVVTNPGPDADGNEQVGFSFRAGNGTTVINANRTPFTLKPITDGEADGLIFRVAGMIFPPSGGFANGSIATFVEEVATGLTQVSLGATPYSNAGGQPVLTMGVGTAGSDFGTPNGIHGIVGGVTSGVTFAAAPALVNAWMDSIAEEYQLVGIDGITSDGWRANNPMLSNGDAPEPLEPFVGVVNMDHANPGNLLDYRTYAPTVFWADTQ